MNECQYARLRQNRRLRAAQGLGQTPLGREGVAPAAAIVAQAAKAQRRWTAAVAAWERIAPVQWQSESTVSAVDGNTIVVAAGSASLLCEIRQRQAALERELARFVPGICRLRSRLAGELEKPLEPPHTG